MMKAAGRDPDVLVPCMKSYEPHWHSEAKVWRWPGRICGQGGWMCPSCLVASGNDQSSTPGVEEQQAMQDVKPGAVPEAMSNRVDFESGLRRLMCFRCKAGGPVEHKFDSEPDMR